MKIVLTGSLGHIGQPLAVNLVQRGHAVTVISSKSARAGNIGKIGATPAIGSIQDIPFLTDTFAGADVVYLMEPPIDFLSGLDNINSYWMDIASGYVEAIEATGVPRIIHLSSIGAHTDQGVGMLATHFHVESKLKELPDSVAIKFMRPVGFYYNMLAFIPTIRRAGAIIQNYGGDEKEPWVSPLDIAAAIGDEVDQPFDGRSVRYVASDEVSPNEVARILGAAIGKPALQWVTVPDAEFEKNLIQAGFSAVAARGFTAMNAARFNGLMDDYYRHRPILGKIKLADFAIQFAAAYKQGSSK
jgi:uncharacterized protein YbjT (DUF2867 family)